MRLNKNFIISIVMVVASLVATVSVAHTSSKPTNYLDLSPELQSKLLGWIEDKETCNVCGGSFIDENIAKDYIKRYAESYGKNPKPLKPNQKAVILSNADHVSYNFKKGGSEYTGNVSVLRPMQRLQSQKARVQVSPKTHQIDKIDFVDGLTLREPDKILLASTANLNLDKNTGQFHNVIYRFTIPTSTDYQGGKYSAKSAWGDAKKMEQVSKGVYNLYDASYTTCPWKSNFWRIKASRININRKTQEVKAYSAVLYIKGIPVAYLPYFSFSMDKKRKTGFLSPLLGRSSNDGFYLGLPFYWNIAPNYDATITPEYFTKRGFVVNGLFRYLTNESQGRISALYAFHDHAFDDFKNGSLPSEYPSATPTQLNDLRNSSSARKSVSWFDKTRFNSEWSAGANVNWVSDDYFLEDFTENNALNTYGLPNQVVQQGDVAYLGKHWSFLGLVQNYQTLHPINLAATQNQYARLPELDLNAFYPNQKFGLAFGVNSQYVNFYKTKNPWDTKSPVTGSRFHVAPSVSLPLSWPDAFLTPQIQLDATKYLVKNNPLGKDQMSRVLPILSVDSGLYFTRSVHLFGNQYTQTFEPRLYYLYVPYENQSDIPLFDTFTQVLNYDEMFLPNRFTGIDRIGDANQVTLGAETRFIDNQTGLQKFSAGIAAIAYFQNRRVMYCTTASCSAANIQKEKVTNSRTLSPIATFAKYNFNSAWSVSEANSFVTQTGQFDSQQVNFQYKPANDKVLNLGYQYERGADPSPGAPLNSPDNDLNRVVVSFAWPLFNRWSVLGAYEYNISHNNGQEFLAGLQYNTCCMGFQVAASREFSEFNPKDQAEYDNSIIFQITLKGLGSLSNNTDQEFAAEIPGYENPLSQQGVNL